MDILEYDLNIANTIVTTDGNVGIGTTSPSSKLDIAGSLNVIGDINFTGNLLQNGGSQWTTTAGNISYTNGTVIVSNLSATGNSNTVGSLFTTGGNVGIGTTSPGAKLDVSGDFAASNATIPQFVVTNASAGALIISNRLQATGNSNTIGTLFTTGGNVGIGTSSPNSKLSIAGNFGIHYDGANLDNYSLVATQIVQAADVRYSFNYRNNNVNYNSALCIGAGSNGGRIGINTTAPGFRLDVNGDFRAYGGRYIIQNGQDGGTGRGIYMWNEGDTNWSIYMGQSGAGKSFSGGTSTTGVYGFNQHDVRFRANNSSANGWIFENNSEEHLMSIRSDDGHVYMAGSVGIGVVSPSYKLHVSGDTRSDGWFRTTGDTGLWSDTYSRGIRPSILGDYGNVETHGEGKGGWEGYSIEGRYVFMSSDNNACGIFNDLDNQWIMYFDRSNTNNKYVQLRHNNNTRLQTTSSGINITGSGTTLNIDTSPNTSAYGIWNSSNLSNNQRLLQFIGKDSNSFNGFYNWYTHYSNNNSENTLSWDANGRDNIFQIRGSGFVQIGNAAAFFRANGSGDQFVVNANGSNGNNGYFYYNSGNGYGSASDKRMKNNITRINNEEALDFINKLNPSQFKMNGDSYYQAGFIAQDILDIAVTDTQKSIVHNWNTYDDSDEKSPLLGVSDRPIVSFLVGALQELNTQLQMEKQKFTNLKAALQSKFPDEF